MHCMFLNEKVNNKSYQLSSFIYRVEKVVNENTLIFAYTYIDR